jgi:hypothetical protein
MEAQTFTVNLYKLTKIKYILDNTLTPNTSLRLSEQTTQ